MFDEYEIRTTFFACGVALERNPEVGPWLSRAGHEPCSHGWRWSEPWLFETREVEQRHMRWAIVAIERACGERPRGWFSRYSGSQWTRELLVEDGGFGANDIWIAIRLEIANWWLADHQSWS